MCQHYPPWLALQPPSISKPPVMLATATAREATGSSDAKVMATRHHGDQDCMTPFRLGNWGNEISLYMVFRWFIYICMIYGLHVDDIWFIYGLHMDDIWLIYGLHMDDIWLIYGEHMDNIWSIYGEHMDMVDISIIDGWKLHS